MNDPHATRRHFLKTLGLAPLPFLLPEPLRAAAERAVVPSGVDAPPPVNFIFDCPFFSLDDYVEKLHRITTATRYDADFYGEGGVTELLEKKFAELTGKPKAIYLPTGTMANQLALHLLSGENTKLLVPENSHIYRDEADAAQTVHNKRLVPVGQNKPYFTRKDLEDAVAYHDEGEVFHSGWGAIAVECPVRRADGAAVPFQTLKEISDYGRSKGYKLHLDGARLHIASAYTGVSVAEYAALFDTVYISLYKYLNAAGGAMLCGEPQVIDKLRHYIKIYGGTVYQTWPNTVMAMHYLEGIDARWKQVVQAAQELADGLNGIQGLHVAAIANGTNIYDLKLDPSISLKKLANTLYEEHNMWLGRADKTGTVKWTVNESIRQREPEEMVAAWKAAVAKAKG